MKFAMCEDQKWVFIFVLLFCVLNCVLSAKNQVVLMSFDGFRWDYLDMFSTPNFDFIAKTGVRALRGMKPAFATKTFPNHFTLVTGLYEESHGIIDNYMFDPVLNETFSKKNTESKWWNGGEPVWITATKQGLVAATYFWVGSYVEYNGLRPKYFISPYNTSVPLRTRLDQVLEWLTKDKVDLAVTYFHEPDSAGHNSGAASMEVSERIKEIDTEIGYFIEELKKNDLLDTVDVVILSDHGMTNRTQDSRIVVDNIVPQSDIKRFVNYGPVAGFYPIDGKLDEVYEKLKGAVKNAAVYKKNEIPEHFHYKNHRRVPPIVILAEPGYTIVPVGDTNYISIGDHGYSNDFLDMRPIFLARGPHFKKDYTIEKPFENVNIYSLMCHLLGINPSPNNGSLESVKDMLLESDDSGACKSNNFNSVIFVVLMINFLVNM